jgi:ribosomal-protein-alanine N-acetyltransferase
MTVQLVRIDVPTFRALQDGDLTRAERRLGLSVPEEFAGAVEIWTYMLGLAADRPENADWLMHAVVVDDAIVGNAGFKGAPDHGLVELGYRISASRRRRGLALAAVHLLLERARREPRVDRVVAGIDPDNAASVGVVTKAGFLPDHDWIHPRWGRQLQFVIATPAPLG